MCLENMSHGKAFATGSACCIMHACIFPVQIPGRLLASHHKGPPAMMLHHVTYRLVQTSTIVKPDTACPSCALLGPAGLGAALSQGACRVGGGAGGVPEGASAAARH